MFVLAPIMCQVPLSALAGILIVTAWRMNDWHDIEFIFGHKFKTGMAKFLITMGATVILDLTWAIIIGVAFASFMVIVKLADIEITIADIESDRLEEIGIHMPKVSKRIRMAYLTGSIFFAVTDKLKAQLSQLGDTEVLILSMRGVPSMDLSGIQALLELRSELEAEGTKVMLTSVQPKVLEDLRRGGLIEAVGEDHVFDSAEYAIVHAHEEIEA
jgi:SulP family sulfate permease